MVEREVTRERGGGMGSDFGMANFRHVSTKYVVMIVVMIVENSLY